MQVSVMYKWLKYLKQRMAVTGQRKEENKAAAVVQDVTNIESPA